MIAHCGSAIIVKGQYIWPWTKIKRQGNIHNNNECTHYVNSNGETIKYYKEIKPFGVLIRFIRFKGVFDDSPVAKHFMETINYMPMFHRGDFWYYSASAFVSLFRIPLNIEKFKLDYGGLVDKWDFSDCTETKHS